MGGGGGGGLVGESMMSARGWFEMSGGMGGWEQRVVWGRSGGQGESWWGMVG